MADRETIERARFIFRVGRMLQQHIFTTFSRIETEHHGCMPLDLSVAQFKLLMTVRHHGEMTLKELADKLDVSSPSVSVMVDRLVERKLLIRERSQQDRRKVVIEVSPTEKKHLDYAEQQVLASFVELLEEVGPETAQKWGEVLARVEQVLEKRQKEQAASSGRSLQ